MQDSIRGTRGVRIRYRDIRNDIRIKTIPENIPIESRRYYYYSSRSSGGHDMVGTTDGSYTSEGVDIASYELLVDSAYHV